MRLPPDVVRSPDLLVNREQTKKNEAGVYVYKHARHNVNINFRHMDAGHGGRM